MQLAARLGVPRLHRLADFLADARLAECLRHPPRPIAPPQQPRRLAPRVSLVVDVAQFGETRGDCGGLRRALTLPPALAQLARKIAF